MYAINLIVYIKTIRYVFLILEINAVNILGELQIENLYAKNSFSDIGFRYKTRNKSDFRVRISDRICV